MNQIEALIKNEKTSIVDVRTPLEFMGGHVAGSVNIPLNEIPGNLEALKSMSPVVLCCASGGRSHQAYMYLLQKGIECCDAGSWLNVNNIKNN